MPTPFPLRHRRFSVLVLRLVLPLLAPTVGISCVNAQEPATTAGASLLPADALRAFKVTGSRNDAGKITIVSARHPEFTEAIRAQTLEQPSKPYEFQLTAPTAAPIAKGDVLFASFWMRTIESPMNEGFTGFIFEQRAEPYQRSMGMETSAGTEWKRIDLPFRAAGSYAAGEAAMNLRLGYAPQTVEIGGITLKDLGANVDLASLPFASPTYTGRAADAPWRKAALERIEKIRKADLAITVVDSAGQPVPGARVQLTQTRSAFPFGASTTAKSLLSDAPSERKYQEMVRTLFNRTTLSNDLKWARWQADRETPLKALDWLRDAGIEARGHNLIWPGFRKMPEDLKALKENPEEMRRRIAEHITEEATAVRGKVVEWDVVNEPFNNHDVMDICGPGILADWFKLAHAADPQAKLFINDWGILSGGGQDTNHQKHYEDTISGLLAAGAPLDGIGMQGHFGWNLTPPEKMLSILDRFAKFGKPIEITEFDVQMTDEKLQADFTRDFLIAMFSHPAVSGVVMWEFWEGHHYAPTAALWRKDWTPKPNGQVWLDLVKRQWMTNLVDTADAGGQVRTRGFLGDYEVTASVGGKSVNQKFGLSSEGKTVRLVVRW